MKLEKEINIIIITCSMYYIFFFYEEAFNLKFLIVSVTIKYFNHLNLFV